MSISWAQTSGSPYRLRSVSQVLSVQGNDHDQVLLIGHILQRLDDDTYLFTDGTGKVKLETEDAPLPLTGTIVVGGRMERGFLGLGGVTVDVEHWRPFHRAGAESFAP